MPIRKYANATPPGGDSDYSVSEYSANHSAYTETTNTINSTVSDYSVSDYTVSSDDTVARAREQLSATLTRMSPAYKAGKARRQADPLAWRLEKILRRLRPMLSAQNFMELATEISQADTMQKVAIAQRLEEWLKHAHGYGDT